MDLVKLITKKLQEVESSGKLEEIIEKNVLSCVNDLVSDSFRFSGEAKGSIKKALEGKLNIRTENLNLARYQKIVSTIVSDHVNNSVVSDLEDKIKESVDSVTNVLEKKKWKLSEVIEQFINSIDTSYDGGMEDQTGCCSFHVIGDGSFVHVYFDEDDDKSHYECENSLSIHDGKLFHAKINSIPLSPFKVGLLNGFDEFIFKLYCNNVEVEIDEDSVDYNYYREDYC